MPTRSDLSLTTLSKLIEEMYSAVDDSLNWSRFLSTLANAFRAPAAVLHTEASDKSVAAFCAVVGLNSEDLERYADHYISVNPYLAKVPVKQATLLWADALVDLHLAEKGEFFNDYLAPLGLGHPSGILVINNRDAISVLTILPDTRRRTLTADELRFLGLLAPHIERAVRLHFTMAGLRTITTAWDEALGTVPLAAILMDWSLRVRTLTHTAERLLEGRDGLRLESGRLRTMIPAAQRPLDLFLRAAQNPLSGNTKRCVFLLERLSGSPLQLFAAPHVRASSDFRDATDYCRGIADVLLVVSDPERRTEGSAEILKCLYDLTVAEAGVALRIIQGDTVTGIATKLCVSESTVKTHLRQIFSKTGVKRQSELVRLLAALPYPRDNIDPQPD